MAVPRPSLLGFAALLLLLLLLLVVAAPASSSSGSCPPAGALQIDIKTPKRGAAPARGFKVKATVTNQGSASLQGLSFTVNLPVQTTLLKIASPATGVVPTAGGGNPWSLLLPGLALAPGKSQAIALEAVVGQAFQQSGSFEVTASVAVPSDPLCPPVEASRTVAIKRSTKSKGGASRFQVNASAVLVECGQPLPFLPPDFPMGACGDRTVADPRVWGPMAWRTLHVMAQNFPTTPTAQAVEACTNFVNALPFLLPSPLAGFTFAEFIRANNENAGTYNAACQASAAYGMPCTTPAQACACQGGLVSFFLRAHQAVNALVQPCRRLWTPQEAWEAYAYDTQFCATCIVWGSYPICKAVGDTGCANVTTTPPCGSVAPPSPSPAAPPTIAPTQSPTTSAQKTVECGITLEPSISNWAMGVCGNRTTADPRVFGPFTWPTLHRFAQHYPVAPSTQTREACVNFINALPFLIPCPHCGYDFSMFIVDNIEHADTFNPACQANATFAMPCTNPTQACAAREALVSFFLRAHHNVDTHTKPCKPLWSREQAAETYTVAQGFCATGILNGAGRLCRGSGDEAGCTTVDTNPPCNEF